MSDLYALVQRAQRGEILYPTPNEEGLNRRPLSRTPMKPPSTLAIGRKK